MGQASGLTLARGTSTPIGSLECSSSTDSVGLTEGYTAPGTISAVSMFNLHRVQYDFINDTGHPLTSWTLHYSSSIGPLIVAALAPIDYIDPSGNAVYEGGEGYSTILTGYGVHSYNTGCPWSIDYEQDHITFTTSSPLPAGWGEGVLAERARASFAVEFLSDSPFGMNPADATAGSILSGTVIGPQPVPEPSSFAFASVAFILSGLSAKRIRGMRHRQGV